LASSGNVSTQGITTNGGAIDINSAGGITTNRQTINTRNGVNDGGEIRLETSNGSINTGNLLSDSYSFDTAGNGGAISLEAANGSISTGDVNSSSSNDIFTTGNLDSSSISLDGNAGQGGAIGLTAANGSITTGDLDSRSFSYGNAGQGGAIGLTAANGSITTGNLLSYSFSFSGNAGQGGAIGLTAANGSITTGDLLSSSFSYGNASQGGAIGLTAANGSITTGNLYSGSFSSYGNAGQGGAIGLTAANGSITTGDLDSSSISLDGNAGQGGAIGLTAAVGSISADSLSSGSYSSYGNAGQGGAIGLTAANDIFIKGDLYSYSYSGSGTVGQGGAISLIARGGDIVGIPFETERYDDVTQDEVTEVRSTPVLSSFSISEKGTAGNGGNVALEAKNNVRNLEILTLSSDSQSGAVQVRGLGDLLLTDTNILTRKRVTVPIGFGVFITLNVGGEGQSGNVDVTSLGNLTFNNSSIQSDTQGIDNAGNVTISSPGLVTFNNSSIRSNTSSTGAAGRIGIEAGQGITLVGMDDFSPVLSVETSSAGQPGSIFINTPSLRLSNIARITATATNTATHPLGGGSITINASTMDLAGVVGVFAETQGQTPAGTLTLQPYENQSTLNLTLAPQSLVSASTSGSGRGGNANCTSIRSHGTIQWPGQTGGSNHR
jgi:hypothetical protein